MIKSRSETCGNHCPSESVRVTIFCQCLVVVFIMSLLKNASILPPCIIILTPSSFRPVVKIIFGIRKTCHMYDLILIEKREFIGYHSFYLKLY